MKEEQSFLFPQKVRRGTKIGHKKLLKIAQAKTAKKEIE
jgi:hypothetical protein